MQRMRIHRNFRPRRGAALGLVALGFLASHAAGNPPAPLGATSAPPSAQRLEGVERELATEARLETILKLALAQNPDLTEARERVRAARELAPAASRLPDPELEYELWAAPLSRPYALDRAEMHMLGVKQAIPAPGSLGARSEAASAQAALLSNNRLAREQDLVARVRRAYAEYGRAEREYRLHLEHARIAEQVLDLARAAYRAGRGTQQDVLRTMVELSRLHSGLVNVDSERRSVRALLNTLMARPVEAPLGPPAPLEPPQVRVRYTALARRLSTQQPTLGAAASSIRVRERELEAARVSARWPSFMLGLKYMFAPLAEEPHHYGVMLSMSLPWFNPRYGEEVRAAEATLAAEQSAFSSARNAVSYELYAAVQQLEAAQESFAIFERDLLPQAQQSFDSIQAAYRGGQGDSLGLLDALRALLEIRIEHERALARYEMALADLERAAGARVVPHNDSPRIKP